MELRLEEDDHDGAEGARQARRDAESAETRSESLEANETEQQGIGGVLNSGDDEADVEANGEHGKEDADDALVERAKPNDEAAADEKGDELKREAGDEEALADEMGQTNDGRRSVSSPGEEGEC